MHQLKMLLYWSSELKNLESIIFLFPSKKVMLILIKLRRMMKKYFWILGLVIFYGCSDNQLDNRIEKTNHEHNIEEADSIREQSKIVEEEQKEKPMSKIEESLIAAGLVDVQSVDSTIQVDVKYATTDNFIGRILYPNYDKVYLQPEVAERLAKAQMALQKLDSNLTLLVFDGARPRSVQQEMWDGMDSLPFRERINFLSNPANGSIHNYGCAVDLTIMNTTTGEWLDMGANYDDLRRIAYPRHEQEFLEKGELTISQIQNRQLLRKVMRAGRFYVIQTEWWHFNAHTRLKATELYDIIE